MPENQQQTLLARIGQAQTHLRQLDTDRRATEKRLAGLQAELASLQDGPDAPTQPVSRSRLTPREKIALFRSLFAGRTDVFAKRWHNVKTGKQGYTPACNNEWVPGVCNKPRIKCGECPNQAFIPISEQILADHLRGRLVAGVYPLLADETCQFLAVDFDKGGLVE